MTETLNIQDNGSNTKEVDTMTDLSYGNCLVETSSDNASDGSAYVKGAARKLWLQNNKEKLAQYARSAYHKRVENDPEYRHVLVQRTLERRHRLRAEKGPPEEKPKKEPVPPPEKKLGGRPRKYP